MIDLLEDPSFGFNMLDLIQPYNFRFFKHFQRVDSLLWIIL